MPVILDNGSEDLRTWLDPKRYEWSNELQVLLKPFDGELEVYPVSKDVGKVGNNSPNFIIPIDSKENKSNIANFFAKGSAAATTTTKTNAREEQPRVEVKKEEGFVAEDSTDVKDGSRVQAGVKREADDEGLVGGEPPRKMATMASNTTSQSSPQKAGGRSKISATSNGTKSSPGKAKQQQQPGTQKITKFFANSS